MHPSPVKSPNPTHMKLEALIFPGSPCFWAILSIKKTINKRWASRETQKHGDPKKNRASNFKCLVLEGYLEFCNETGTVEKLCVSTFTLHKLFCTPSKISVSKSKKTEQMLDFRNIWSKYRYPKSSPAPSFRLRCRSYSIRVVSWTSSRSWLFGGVPGRESDPVALDFQKNLSFWS